VFHRTLSDWIFPALMAAAGWLCWFDPARRMPRPLALADGPRPEPEPYQPTEADLREYAEWSAGLDHDLSAFCPADFGHRCEHCEALAAEHDRELEARSDGWYLDLANRAASPGFDPHDGWRD
jgi:hypothetical protein